jgi:hypothetical protein
VFSARRSERFARWKVDSPEKAVVVHARRALGEESNHERGVAAR